MVRAFCLFLQASFLFNIPAIAQSSFQARNFHIQHFGEDEGLSQNSVNNFIPDKNGFLWVGYRKRHNPF
jgi:hypothetical protein